MNRGINDEYIFESPALKEIFLNLLEEKSRILKIRIFAYCVMGNHFHLILENTSGRFSDFLKQVSSQYAMCYRKKTGGKGYVFQGRFNSTLIENDSYLISSIIYTLLNPVRAGLVKEYNEYTWSSANAYFIEGKGKQKPGIIDVDFVEGLFGSKEELTNQINLNIRKELPEFDSKFGMILGSRNFLAEAEKKFDRRKKPDAVKRKRVDDRYFEPVEKVIYEFEKKNGVEIETIRTDTHHGKRLRGELLVLLKDMAGLKYREIIEFPCFDNLQYSSLGDLYKSTKKRMQEGACRKKDTG